MVGSVAGHALPCRRCAPWRAGLGRFGGLVVTALALPGESACGRPTSRPGRMCRRRVEDGEVACRSHRTPDEEQQWRRRQADEHGFVQMTSPVTGRTMTIRGGADTPPVRRPGDTSPVTDARSSPAAGADTSSGGGNGPVPPPPSRVAVALAALTTRYAETFPLPPSEADPPEQAVLITGLLRGMRLAQRIARDPDVDPTDADAILAELAGAVADVDAEIARARAVVPWERLPALSVRCLEPGCGQELDAHGRTEADRVSWAARQGWVIDVDPAQPRKLRNNVRCPEHRTSRRRDWITHCDHPSGCPTKLITIAETFAQAAELSRDAGWTQPTPPGGKARRDTVWRCPEHGMPTATNG